MANGSFFWFWGKSVLQGPPPIITQEIITQVSEIMVSQVSDVLITQNSPGLMAMEEESNGI